MTGIKITKLKKFEVPTWMIHQSFRYVLGRRSYAVSDWCAWFLSNIDSIPTNELVIIYRELKEAIEQNEDDIAEGKEYSCLGDDMDREWWLKVYYTLN